MVTNNQIKKIRENRFKKRWNTFVNNMNSGKKPFILRLFNSKYPHNDTDKKITQLFFNDGFYDGAMYMSEQTDKSLSKTTPKKKKD